MQECTQKEPEEKFVDEELIEIALASRQCGWWWREGVRGQEALGGAADQRRIHHTVPSEILAERTRADQAEAVTTKNRDNSEK